ncbi:hypothetical protein DLAC_00270 [Tieghemostelium lacteum]|uniref:Uncharacterized protein n=1 Tax=Tieghemostelium lacteum TaxID=361077 RepID=A0A152A9J6_TIELA|nr:hypothetical protein DLAC_00270 [Tieghemostelium lacteum]|eukprot:KYR02805.1 hypothetical protein DLAC_00270 [Tieghemostelium lacteum]
MYNHNNNNNNGEDKKKKKFNFRRMVKSIIIYNKSSDHKEEPSLEKITNDTVSDHKDVSWKKGSIRRSHSSLCLPKFKASPKRTKTQKRFSLQIDNQIPLLTESRTRSIQPLTTKEPIQISTKLISKLPKDMFSTFGVKPFTNEESISEPTTSTNSINTIISTQLKKSTSQNVIKMGLSNVNNSISDSVTMVLTNVNGKKAPMEFVINQNTRINFQSSWEFSLFVDDIDNSSNPQLPIAQSPDISSKLKSSVTVASLSQSFPNTNIFRSNSITLHDHSLLSSSSPRYMKYLFER